ncbi:LOW QUALITY PROTEIN: Znf1 protein [Plakobranchus ocellatus]|uniref:Znf1 protein n=1 Tax=Plakobranchus ocellatus TaxID=259542 RepID=A0AAV3YN12_9GAST|nr:LOW QUALITY PROTEIN: Znf1 protein [Plakobranchus ocellatus]
MNSQCDDNASHECDNASFDLFDDDEDEIENSTVSSSSGQVDVLVELNKNPSACDKHEESTPLYSGVHTPTFDNTKKEILMDISEHKLNHEEKDNKFALSCKDEGHSFSLTSKALQNNEEHPSKRYKAQGQNDDRPSFEKSPSADMSCKSDMTSNIELSLSPSEECAVRFSRVHDYNADVLTFEDKHWNSISSEKVETNSHKDHDVDEKETDTAVCAEKNENKAFSFPCPFCCVQESCVLLLEHHILAAHPEIPEQPEATCVAESAITSAFQFVCPLCDMDLETELAYNSHLNVAHPDGAPTDCDNLANGPLSCPLCYLFL